MEEHDSTIRGEGEMRCNRCFRWFPKPENAEKGELCSECWKELSKFTSTSFP